MEAAADTEVADTAEIAGTAGFADTEVVDTAEVAVGTAEVVVDIAEVVVGTAEIAVGTAGPDMVGVAREQPWLAELPLKR